MVFRFPPTVNREDISTVETKPKNLLFELETETERRGNPKKYKSRKLVNKAPLVGARFQADGLHLTPIQSSHEFKYCLSHLKTSSKQRSTNEEIVPIDAPEPVKVAAVTMRFAAVDEEEKRRIREGTFNHHREVISREKSIQLNYQPLPDEEVRKAVKLEPMET